MNNLIGLLRELRLMKDQPTHRFFAVWLLVLLPRGVGWGVLLYLLHGWFPR